MDPDPFALDYRATSGEYFSLSLIRSVVNHDGSAALTFHTDWIGPYSAIFQFDRDLLGTAIAGFSPETPAPTISLGDFSQVFLDRFSKAAGAIDFSVVLKDQPTVVVFDVVIGGCNAKGCPGYRAQFRVPEVSMALLAFVATGLTFARRALKSGPARNLAD